MFKSANGTPKLKVSFICISNAPKQYLINYYLWYFMTALTYLRCYMTYLMVLYGPIQMHDFTTEKHSVMVGRASS